MNQSHTPIYSSRLAMSYLQYLRRFYPDVDVGALLAHAGMTAYEVEDPAHWFSQDQMDRFHEIMDRKAGGANIAREAGRFMTKAEGMGPAKNLLLGLVNIQSVFLLSEKLTPLLTRGSRMTVVPQGPQQIEVISRPLEGVREKRYQCENRMGIFEGLPRLFTEQYARVEHPECVHRGDERCRYTIFWQKTAAFTWKRIRNIAIYLTIPVLLPLGLLMPAPYWWPLFLAGLSVTFSLALKAEQVAKTELARTLDAVSGSAQNQIDAARVHYTNARVVQEIGQIAASNLDVDRLLQEVAGVLKRRLSYGHCGIFLHDSAAGHLTFAAGYGYDDGQLERLRVEPIRLDASGDGDIFRSAIENQTPVITETPWEMPALVYPASEQTSSQGRVPRGIVVPLAGKQPAIGLLAVFEADATSPVTASDINFLLAIASQVAVGLDNAAAFHKLQESESKFRQILESIQEGYFEVDLEGRFTYVNPALCGITGYSATELYGMEASGYADAATRDKLVDISREISLTGRPVQLALFDFVGKNERQMNVELSVAPIKDKKGGLTGFRGIVRDVSDRIRAEKDREKLQRHLQQIQKLESIGKLAGGIAHNFNNLLMGIQGNISLINLDIDPDSDTAKKTANIESIIASASKLTGQLLGFARGGKYLVHRMDLNELIEASAEAFAMTQRNIRVRRSLLADLPAIEADRNQLEQVLWNLYINAADAMPKGGDILIETRVAVREDMEKLAFRVKPGRYVRLLVTDTGTGMPPEVRARVFEPFFTTKEVGKGTGLGLASVYGIVKSHGGYIDVESTRGQGTTFTIYLPACLPAAGAHPKASAAPQTASAKN